MGSGWILSIYYLGLETRRLPVRLQCAVLHAPGTFFCHLALVHKNHLTSGSGPFPHFPSRDITFVVENDFKP